MKEKKALLKSLENSGFWTSLTVMILGIIVLIYVLI